MEYRWRSTNLYIHLDEIQSDKRPYTHTHMKLPVIMKYIRYGFLREWKEYHLFAN